MQTLKRTAVLTALTLTLTGGFLAGSVQAQDNSGSGQSGAQSNQGSRGEAAQEMRDDGFDMGWLGLAGLAGLLGLRKKPEPNRYVAAGTNTGAH